MRLRKIGKWYGPRRIPGATGTYYEYHIDGEVDHDTSVDYGRAHLNADYTDERNDQNVNWEVEINGSPVKRGWARTIRKAKAAALVALRSALYATRPRRYTKRRRGR